MVCDRVTYRSWVQMIYFVGYMIGSIFFGILADKFVVRYSRRRKKIDVYFDRYGRRPIMSVSFILMTVSSFLCSFAPQESLGFWPSYLLFILARFLLACSTRGISVSGFVLGSEIGMKISRIFSQTIRFFFSSRTKETSSHRNCHRIFLRFWTIHSSDIRLFHSRLATIILVDIVIYNSIFILLFVSKNSPWRAEEFR